MAYAKCSEVYFAVGTANKIKIGETTNARRRNHQLNGYHIHCSIDLQNKQYSDSEDEAMRKFVEAGLRVILEDYTQQRISTDCFICESREDVEDIEEQFEYWVEELEKIAKKIKKKY